MLICIEMPHDSAKIKEYVLAALAERDLQLRSATITGDTMRVDLMIPASRVDQTVEDITDYFLVRGIDFHEVYKET